MNMCWVTWAEEAAVSDRVESVHAATFSYAPSSPSRVKQFLFGHLTLQPSSLKHLLDWVSFSSFSIFGHFRPHNGRVIGIIMSSMGFIGWNNGVIYSCSLILPPLVLTITPSCVDIFTSISIHLASLPGIFLVMDLLVVMYSLSSDIRFPPCATAGAL